MRKYLVAAFFLSVPIQVCGHGPGEDHAVSETIIGFIGGLHPIAVHFPIALLIMTGIAELLALWKRSGIFEYSAQFLIICAAIFSFPAALLGLAWAYGAVYSGNLADLFWWHRFLGLSIPLLATAAAALKLLHVYGKSRVISAYYTVLAVAIVSVTATGYLGGEMVFGTFQPGSP